MQSQYILANSKRELILQIIPMSHELWKAGINMYDPIEYLNLVKTSLEETNPKPQWAGQVLEIIG